MDMHSQRTCIRTRTVENDALLALQLDTACLTAMTPIHQQPSVQAHLKIISVLKPVVSTERN